MSDRKNISSTEGLDYTNRLINKRNPLWKKLLSKYVDLQLPYRWNLKRLNSGLTLEIGCGIGRNLTTLQNLGVGIDHNVHSVEVSRSLGLIAFTPSEFKASSFNKPNTFDSLLLSHVAEHMTLAEVIEVLNEYLGLLKPNGILIIITPQEVGYGSDSTHIEFMNFQKLRYIYSEINFRVIKEYSFPFPRFFGNLFIYNEFVSVGKLICD
jgi:2-polyprenyl-3-methyl-5-hydroxy-6-metoxy-1,4-benzoquinol methylase